MSTRPASKPCYVAYFRVSTDRQGKSGLGLEAQKSAVEGFLATSGGQLLSSFTEVESGKRSDRPQLKLAIEACRKHKAKLLIAKLDRLARNAAFLLTLRDSGVEFIAADMPQADKLTVGIMALFAEHERDMISKRTKEALAQAKLRGIKLGNPSPAEAGQLGAEVNRAKAVAFAGNVLPLVNELKAKGLSLRQIAAELTARAVPTARGGAWEATTVRNLLNKPLLHPGL